MVADARGVTGEKEVEENARVTAAFPTHPRQHGQFIRPADDLAAVHRAVFLRQQALAGTHQHGGERLQLDLRGIRRRDEIPALP